jgi:hypothetical protein
MRVETEQGGGGVVPLCNLPQLLQHSAMPGVNTIEGSDGQNRGFRSVVMAGEF